MQALVFFCVKNIRFLLQGIQVLLPGGNRIFAVQAYRVKNSLPQLINTFLSRCIREYLISPRL
ncbi:hypothetical protein D3C81_2051010 [compost metagenome]